MTGRKIFSIGETVFDIIFKGDQPVASKPGGSMLNAAVSLGRLGLPVHMVTELGRDDVGQRILRFLSDNQVDTSYTAVDNRTQTALALAFLDDQEIARYSFYKNYSPDRLPLKLPKLKSDDLLLFGSFFALASEIRDKLTGFLQQAHKAGAVILYDPNVRNPHPGGRDKLLQLIHENIGFADIIRGSDDDFRMIFKAESADEAYQEISKQGKKILIYTAGSGEVQLRSAYHTLELKVPKIAPVSTIGAGDSFNAGVLYSLFKLKIGKHDLASLKKDVWNTIVDSGITFGTYVCESYDNYISREFARKIRNSED